jgi:hypothetical protein
MNRTARALLGYYKREEALAALKGGELLMPGDAVEPLEAKWKRIRQAVDARPPIQVVDPIVKTPPDVVALLESAQRREDLRAGFGPLSWSVALVDLSKPILSFQKVIAVEDATDRVKNANPDDLSGLLDICLPLAQTVELEGGFDQAQNAFTTSSLNPNLRIGAFAVVDTPTPVGGGTKMFGFTLSLGSSWIQVVRYKDRWMVRDGYHRLYGLLKRGIQVVPCVVVEAKTFDETGADRPGFFSYEVLYGTRPPLLQDFLTDEFSAEVRTQAVRKIVRIKAEEFVVPV